MVMVPAFSWQTLSIEVQQVITVKAFIFADTNNFRVFAKMDCFHGSNFRESEINFRGLYRGAMAP